MLWWIAARPATMCTKRNRKQQKMRYGYALENQAMWWRGTP